VKDAPPQSGRRGRPPPAYRSRRSDSRWWEEASDDDFERPGLKRRQRHGFLEIADPWRWSAGVLGLTILLAAQIVLFEGRRLAQNVHARPWLDTICANLGCALPPFKDIRHLQITDRALNRMDGNKRGLEFSLTFVNRSALPQAFPELKLVLNELGGSPIAERLFEPQDYLPEWRPGMLMPVGQPFEIRLSLAKPSREVGGFAIQFQ
jgi:hypothetical protein